MPDFYSMFWPDKLAALGDWSDEKATGKQQLS